MGLAGGSTQSGAGRTESPVVVTRIWGSGTSDEPFGGLGGITELATGAMTEAEERVSAPELDAGRERMAEGAGRVICQRCFFSSYTSAPFGSYSRRPLNYPPQVRTDP